MIGRSGSGKSTFFKGLIGQAKKTKGEIQINTEENKKDILDYLGYSPQENSIYPFLTIEENIKIFSQLQNIPIKERKPRMESLLKRLDLTEHKHKKIIELSGGMKKRTDLAVTLIKDPKIIILDEPFNGLDIALQKFIWEFLIEQSKEKKIIIISSHIIKDIKKNCNKLIIIENNSCYTNEQIQTYLKNHKEESIDTFLQKVFDKKITKKEKKW